ncbi:ABC-1 domain-containing protein (plasmid) [Sulfuricurvum kujiense DSM 16994]|uniref:ABC-1 domain-containing protein n=1 Tax=Sulfuricurvum kujiense (strain ATCC BAA-921 / DSM 16994 / JCM 11577 / YK-1) TaxID=709032 RepID=E4U3N6_SULKY|nr:AarF/ABC1/UbiB kinase family protein [Sulfuricurvum kujiense]ADR35302.1 ABC-1 domain-containing protein [Sulfuricurvum kujiense DSM 16994]
MLDNLRQIERVKNIVTILIRNGFYDIVKSSGLDKYSETVNLKVNSIDPIDNRSKRIRITVEELGSTFIKMAQILSTRPDLIPVELAEEFSKLQDQVTPLPFDQIKVRFFEEFGKEVDEIFDGELTLIASASLGQVYTGCLYTGEKVAVKVLKPNIEESIRLDLNVLRYFANVLQNRLQSYGIQSPEKIVDEFEKAILKELNYEIEALNLNRFSGNFQGNEHIAVPKLYKEYSSKHVLTMEFIEGAKVTDLETLRSTGNDPKDVAKKGFYLYCEQIFNHLFFHADPHPGNIFVLSNGKIVFVDFGMMGNISKNDRKNFMEMIYYIVNKQEEKAAHYILKLSRIENDHLDEKAFTRDMSEVIRTHFYASLQDLKLKTFINETLALMRKYSVYFHENNYLLVKGLITIEGIGKTLDPDFNAAETIRPFITRYYKENMSLSFLLTKVSELPKEIVNFLTDFPQDIRTIMDRIKEGKITIELEHSGLAAMEESLEKSANRLSIAIIIASILIGSALLLLAHTPPLLFGIPIFGLAGFLVAIIMSFILIFSIYQKGRL